ncbi:hypothetical protein ACFYVR_03285 [Rhodococcus sp. NPDC003318]|uniref:hypothetical protein n=1 Tax=Rhodococcus sp. NPDC003318 TaxID=3364503 RepID=UPI0036BCBD9C
MSARKAGAAAKTRLLLGASLVALLVAVFATLTGITRTEAASESARASALSESPALLEKVLGYNAPTVDEDLAAAAAVTTGSFRDSFTDYTTKTVAPQSKKLGVSTRARVMEIGFLSGADDHVRLLAFVDQITTSTAQPAPVATSSRVEVTVDLVDGQWRIAELTPV